MNAYSGTGSSSGSTSIRGGRSHRTTAAPWCKCGMPCVVYTSRTPKNPNRAFFGCISYKGKKPYCDFFRWVDDASIESVDLEEGRNLKMDMNVAEMDFKFKYLEMKLNEQVKANEQINVKVNEQQMKIIDLSRKVEKEISYVGRCSTVLGVTICIVFMFCVYVGSRLQ